MNNHEEYLKVKWPDYQDFMELEGAETFMEAGSESTYMFIEKNWFEKNTILLNKRKALSRPDTIHIKSVKSWETGLVPIGKSRYEFVTNGPFSIITNGTLIQGLKVEGGEPISVGTVVPGTKLKVQHIMMVDGKYWILID